jgi:hypothetical protein
MFLQVYQEAGGIVDEKAEVLVRQVTGNRTNLRNIEEIQKMYDKVSGTNKEHPKHLQEVVKKVGAWLIEKQSTPKTVCKVCGNLAAQKKIGGKKRKYCEACGKRYVNINNAISKKKKNIKKCRKNILSKGRLTRSASLSPEIKELNSKITRWETELATLQNDLERYKPASGTYTPNAVPQDIFCMMSSYLPFSTFTKVRVTSKAMNRDKNLKKVWAQRAIAHNKEVEERKEAEEKAAEAAANRKYDLKKIHYHVGNYFVVEYEGFPFKESNLVHRNELSRHARDALAAYEEEKRRHQEEQEQQKEQLNLLKKLNEQQNQQLKQLLNN